MSKPVKTYKVGTVQLAVWEQKFDDGVAYSYSLSKNYLDKKTNEWKSTSSLKANEIQFAIKVLELAFADRYVKVDTKEDF